MNKDELTLAVEGKLECTKKEAGEAVNAVLESIAEGLEKDGLVQFIGFGTFKVAERAARQGRNPRKPEEVIEIPASKAVTFKVGKSLKDRVNK